MVLEQHPDRALLFLRWQGIEWPVWSDPMDLLDLAVVPRSFLLDAEGSVVAVDPRPDEVRAYVVAVAGGGAAVAADASAPVAIAQPELAFLAGRHDEALRGLLLRVASSRDGGRTRFRLGVTRMALAERDDAPAGLFAAALDDWRRALDENPSQYVWRRRVQQYGPLLDKPYPFYDWVEQARAELRARGVAPPPLRVEPAGAELAAPRRDAGAASVSEEPDPGRRMPAAPPGVLSVEPAVVESTQHPGLFRVHLRLRLGAGAEWNDEADPSIAWLRAPAGWELVDGSLAVLSGGGSGAPRRFEFELRRTGEGDPVEAGGYALVELCTAPDGLCARWRLDFRVPLP